MPQIKKITDLTAPELDLFSRYSESQLFHINEPKPGIFIAESPNVIERALNAGYEPLAVLIEEKQADGLIPKLFFAYPELPVYTAKFDLLINLTGFALTRGLLCDTCAQKIRIKSKEQENYYERWRKTWGNAIAS